jgi:GTPase
MKKLNLKDILDNTSDLTKEKQVWYVSIIGRPNVGKSTFINTLIWKKISITTNVPQTTRRKVLWIFNDEDSQIIFVDTPGIHKSEKTFNEQINNVAIGTFSDSDLILYFIDTSRKSWEEEKFIEELITGTNKPVLRVYTKSDLKSKITLPLNSLPNREGGEKEDVFKISSISKKWFPELLTKIKSFLKVGPILFPEDFYTKQDTYFRISEIIREKVFLHTKEEIPHSIFVWVEEISDEKDIFKIVAYIYAESDSGKYIIIWKSWNLITKIWTEARIELEQIFSKKVFLSLRVKVRKNWRKDEKLVKKILN